MLLLSNRQVKLYSTRHQTAMPAARKKILRPLCVCAQQHNVSRILETTHERNIILLTLFNILP